METAVQDQIYQAELATQHAATGADTFEQMMMRAGFDAEFGAYLGAPVLEGSVQFSGREIDAQVAEFAAELNRMEAAAESDEADGLSAFDREFLAENQISMRALSEGELADMRATHAKKVEYDEFAFSQLMQSGKDSKDEPKN